MNATAPNGAAAFNGSRLPAGLWCKLFHSATEAQRAAWLEQAQAQGVLQAQALGPANPPDARRTLVADLLGDRAPPLDAPSGLAAGQLAFFDSHLDAEQRRAVESAIAAPDLFLLQGLPGTGKSRVLAEIASQGALRGWKILLTARSPLALERVFDHFSSSDHILAVRWLDEHEDAERLPGSVRPHTLPGRAERLKGESLTQTDREIGTRLQERDALVQDQRVLSELRPTAVQAHAREKRREELAAERLRVNVAVAVETDPATSASSALVKQLENEQARHQAALLELDKRIEEADALAAARHQDLQKWQAQVRAQTEVMEARKHWRYFGLRFWRGLLQGRPHQRLEEFKCRENEAAAASDAAKTNLEGLQAQRTVEVQRSATAREQILAAEIARRQTELDQQLAELLNEQNALAEAWTALRSRLRNADELAGVPSTAALDDLLRRYEERRTENQRLLDFALSWKDTLAGLRPDADALLVPYVNLLAATISSLGAGPPHALFKQQFDLVLIDQADLLSAAELGSLSALGCRCVLAGHPTPPALEGSAAHHQPPLAAFHELWRRLHAEPRSLPYQWLQDGSTLVCQLVCLNAEQRGRLERERLVDQPEVELRILNQPNDRPVLAEVVFTGGAFTIHTAKAYLYQQLGELTLRPEGSTLRWRQQGAQLVLDLGVPTGDERTMARVGLEDGVCEIVQPQTGQGNGKAPVRWSTVRLEFDGDQGWTRQRAAEWLRERAGLAEHGRSAALGTNYRASPEVAAFVCQVLDERVPDVGKRLPGAVDGAVRLIAVTAPQGTQHQQPRGGKPRPAATGPALPGGHELDLVDPRQRQRLPLELQLKLPMRGCVNLAEAEEVVRLLVKLASQCGGAAPRIAVLAWQSPQVQLLEHLWQRSTHAPAGASARFHTVAGFRDGEADVVVLSLTRSHDQRPQPFAEHAAEWRLALGAARRQLILVGDLSALQRRGQAQDLLVRQNAYLAAHERGVCAKLARHFTSVARSPRPAAAREGVAP